MIRTLQVPSKVDFAAAGFDAGTATARIASAARVGAAKRVKRVMAASKFGNLFGNAGKSTLFPSNLAFVSSCLRRFSSTSPGLCSRTFLMFRRANGNQGSNSRAGGAGGPQDATSQLLK